MMVSYWGISRCNCSRVTTLFRLDLRDALGRLRRIYGYAFAAGHRIGIDAQVGWGAEKNPKGFLDDTFGVIPFKEKLQGYPFRRD
jgi:hypothetical protein